MAKSDLFGIAHLRRKRNAVRKDLLASDDAGLADLPLTIHAPDEQVLVKHIFVDRCIKFTSPHRRTGRKLFPSSTCAFVQILLKLGIHATLVAK